MEILAVIWGILCLILFFKIWGACNNIKRIADKYAPNLDKEHEKRKLPHSTIETKEEIEDWLKGDK